MMNLAYVFAGMTLGFILFPICIIIGQIISNKLSK